MSLIQQIKKDQLRARKNKNTTESTILTTLIGESEAIGKNNGNRESTDNEVVVVIKKFIKNNLELINLVKPESDRCKAAICENKLLTNYIPTQLVEAELRTIIQKRISTLSDISPKLMGKTMTWLKENYTDQYDGKLASKVVKDLLS